jgi:hypothetical protein
LETVTTAKYCESCPEFAVEGPLIATDMLPDALWVVVLVVVVDVDVEEAVEDVVGALVVVDVAEEVLDVVEVWVEDDVVKVVVEVLVVVVDEVVVTLLKLPPDSVIDIEVVGAPPSARWT